MERYTYINDILSTDPVLLCCGLCPLGPCYKVSSLPLHSSLEVHS